MENIYSCFKPLYLMDLCPKCSCKRVTIHTSISFTRFIINVLKTRQCAIWFTTLSDKLLAISLLKHIVYLFQLKLYFEDLLLIETNMIMIMVVIRLVYVCMYLLSDMQAVYSARVQHRYRNVTLPELIIGSFSITYGSAPQPQTQRDESFMDCIGMGIFQGRNFYCCLNTPRIHFLYFQLAVVI